jgi:hypothetical protein
MDVNFKQLMDRQDTEFFQLALLAILLKGGGIISFTKEEIANAAKFMGDITEINGKWIIKAVPKPTNFDEVKANEFFEEARRNAQLSQVPR